MQKRLSMVPAHRDWLQADLLATLRTDAESLRERLDATLPTLLWEEPATEPGRR